MGKAFFVMVAVFLAFSSIAAILAEGEDEGRLSAKVFRIGEFLGERLSAGVAYRLGAVETGRQFEGLAVEQLEARAQPAGPLITIPYRSPTAKFSRNLIVTYDIGNRALPERTPHSRQPQQPRPHSRRLTRL